MVSKDRYQEFLDYAAKKRIFFNYHDKAEILECLNYSDTSRLENWLDQRGLRHLATRLTPITLAELLAGLRTLLRTGTINRSDARQCPLLERQTAILRSLFGSYIFYSFPA